MPVHARAHVAWPGGLDDQLPGLADQLASHGRLGGVLHGVGPYGRCSDVVVGVGSGRCRCRCCRCGAAAHQLAREDADERAAAGGSSCCRSLLLSRRRGRRAGIDAGAAHEQRAAGHKEQARVDASAVLLERHLPHSNSKQVQAPSAKLRLITPPSTLQPLMRACSPALPRTLSGPRVCRPYAPGTSARDASCAAACHTAGKPQSSPAGHGTSTAVPLRRNDVRAVARGGASISAAVGKKSRTGAQGFGGAGSGVASSSGDDSAAAAAAAAAAGNNKA